MTMTSGLEAVMAGAAEGQGTSSRLPNACPAVASLATTPSTANTAPSNVWKSLISSLGIGGTQNALSTERGKTDTQAALIAQSVQSLKSAVEEPTQANYSTGKTTHDRSQAHVESSSKKAKKFSFTPETTDNATAGQAISINAAASMNSPIVLSQSLSVATSAPADGLLPDAAVVNSTSMEQSKSYSLKTMSTALPGIIPGIATSVVSAGTTTDRLQQQLPGNQKQLSDLPLGATNPSETTSILDESKISSNLPKAEISANVVQNSAAVQVGSSTNTVDITANKAKVIGASQQVTASSLSLNPVDRTPIHADVSHTANVSTETAQASITDTVKDTKDTAKAVAQPSGSETIKQSVSTTPASINSVAQPSATNALFSEHMFTPADTTSHVAAAQAPVGTTVYDASAQTAFTALDAGGDSSNLVWKHANTHTAEAGYQDSTLGWIGVRAQQDASGVHATIVPVSQDAAQSLGTHLAGLNTYLSEHQMPVHTVTVTTPEAFTASTASGGQGGGGQTQDQGANGYAEVPVVQSEKEKNTETVTPTSYLEVDSVNSTRAYYANSTYISVTV